MHIHLFKKIKWEDAEGIPYIIWRMNSFERPVAKICRCGMIKIKGESLDK